MHADPAHAWTLESMAGVAAISRSSFAAAFRQQLGESPGDYLPRWRMSVAQALMRAFKQEVGMPPTAWARAEGGRFSTER